MRSIIEIRKILTVGVLTFGLFACGGDDRGGAELKITAAVASPGSVELFDPITGNLISRTRSGWTADVTTQACTPTCAKTLKDVKEETGGKGVSKVTIDLSQGNTVLVPGTTIQMAITLLRFGTPTYTHVFQAHENNGIISFTDPAAVDAWAEPYLHLTHGLNLELSYTTVVQLGLNTDVLQLRLAGKVINTVAKSRWRTEADLSPMGDIYNGGT